MAEINSSMSDKLKTKPPIPKPDFSVIEEKENSFSYKLNGSYKKPKNYVPESPMKSPSQKSFTPNVNNSTNFSKISRKRLDFSNMGSNIKSESPMREESPENGSRFFDYNKVNINLISNFSEISPTKKEVSFNELIHDIEMEDKFSCRFFGYNI
jgi:hypothetical protein